MTQATSRHDSDKRVIRTKKAIKEALFKLLEEKDISAVTISELAKKANLNRRTFYTHYSNLTDILDEIEGELVDSLTKLVEDFDQSDFSASTKKLFMGLNELITVKFDYYFDLVRVDTRGVLVSRLKTVIRSTTDKLLEQVCSVRDKRMDVMSAFIVGGFFNAYLEWHCAPADMPPELASEIVSGMVANCVEYVKTSMQKEEETTKTAL